MIRRSDLKHKVVFQEKTEVPDDMGGFNITWQDYATTMAAVWPLRSKERLESMKLEHQISHRVTLLEPCPAGINERMRIKFKNRFFYINSVYSPDELNRELHIIATEKT